MTDEKARKRGLFDRGDLFREVKFLEDGDEEFVEEGLDWRHGRYNVNWSSDGS